ncbi:MAG: hypothetical protein DRG78_13135 [Epsilonproteobacteria bacterium]|nr:MAG: hypothetical protein DRG78_13135 [Campylobacterota bacterium]
MFKKIVLGLIGLLVIGGGALFAINGKDSYDATKYSATVSDGMNIGSKISFSLPDQFDKKHTLSESTKTVILSFAKATGHTVKEFLEKEPADYLSSRDAFFVADISPMPTVIRNTFALPDLRKSRFSVLLIYDKAIASQIKDESKADKIAILTLDNGVITATKYIQTQEELIAALN